MLNTVMSRDWEAKFTEKRRDGGFRAGKMSFASRVLLPLLLSSMVSTVTSQRLCGRRLFEALSLSYVTTSIIDLPETNSTPYARAHRELRPNVAGTDALTRS
ncbi:hypothetical protein PRIPAC_87093 [Pristionchus pacificus]|uniref:Uncharacterized protein n=1 Tax=Pristionchus pacificus TaxID=54126 RepID=A0A2A6CW63_PRIPA|nr:hypothetical protein PRIPAC_87093 [Pristionchus pacificus]|eukprot:PDM82326.1 hypothetical protein PRIPAC_36719 [Pristionchus pacificus]